MELTVSKVLAWIAGVVAILMGLFGILLSPIGGLILILVGVFALPPSRRALKTRQDIQISKYLVAVIVVIGWFVGAGVIAGGMISDVDTPGQQAPAPDGSDTTPEATDPDDSSQDSDPTATEAQALTHQMGETFTVGSGAQTVEYIVNKAYTTDRIGTESFGEEADGQFVVLIITMKNTGDDSFDVSDRHLRLVDSQDREFEADWEAGIYVESDPRFDTEAVSYEQLQPGLEITRAVVFDVNPDGDYQFMVNPVGVFSDAESHYVELETEPA